MTKDQFLDKTCCRWSDRWNLNTTIVSENWRGAFSIQPALMHRAAVEDGMYLISAAGGGHGGHALVVWRVRNAQKCCTLGNQSSPDIEVKSRTVGRYSKPPRAPQKGTTTTEIDTGDSRLLYAFWKEGRLSTGQGTGTKCGSTACIAFTELDVSAYPTIRVVNDFTRSGGGLYRYYPHAAVNAEGNKTMVFSASNKNQFVDVRFVGIPSSSICRNCLDGPDTVIQPGWANHVRLDPDKENRWGDYSGASPDPDGIGIWVHGEFAGGCPPTPPPNTCSPQPNTWGTWVALTRESGAKIAADLVPVPILPPAGFCNFSANQRLIITVRNRGNTDALPSITRVDFGNVGTVSLNTPGILANNSVDVEAVIPPSCFVPDCSFKITVDSTDVIDELDESNNNANGQCVG